MGNNETPSLFVRHVPKRGRVCLMLGASLLFHGGLIGIAAFWSEPQPGDGTVIIDITDAPSGPVSVLPVGLETPTIESAPTPYLEELPAPTVPTVEKDVEFAENPSTPPPRKSSVSRPVTPSRAARPSSAGPASNQPGTGVQGNDIPSGNGPASATSRSVWVMPHPPYPHVSSLARPVGSTTVRILTDAAGQVSNVVIVKSAGNPLLDNQTQNFVRTNWHGPPNASRTTEFVYQIK